MSDLYKEFADHELSNGVTVRQLQMKLLEIFKYFKSICEKNGLTYWCGGGTMLGAVRHKGFIPWDDDLDVFMPRRDYERLYQIWDKVADTSQYRLVRTDRLHNYHHTDMSLVDIRTTFVNWHNVNEDIFHGCSIDVIPFEGSPNSVLGRIEQIYHTIIFAVFNAQRIPDNQGELLKIPVKLLLGAVKDPEKRYQIWKKHETEMSKYDFYTSRYVKETITNFKAMMRKYDRSDFETIDAVFEGETVKIPKGYDSYMKRIYGNYMSHPDNILESMKTRYNVIKYIDLESPYTVYKGIHYLVK